MTSPLKKHYRTYLFVTNIFESDELMHNDELMSKGISEFKAGKFLESINYFRQALLTAPNSKYIKIWLAKALIRSNQSLDAINLIRGILSDHPDYSPGWFYLAKCIADQGDFEEAAAAYSRGADTALRRAIIKDKTLSSVSTGGPCMVPKFYEGPGRTWCRVAGECLLGEGKIFAKLNRYEEALPALMACTHLLPDCADATFTLGYVLSQQKRFSEAIEVFRNSVSLNPTYAPARSFLAAMLMCRGYDENLRNAHSAAAYEAHIALKIDPNDEIAQMVLRETRRNKILLFLLGMFGL